MRKINLGSKAINVLKIDKKVGISETKTINTIMKDINQEETIKTDSGKLKNTAKKIIKKKTDQEITVIKMDLIQKSKDFQKINLIKAEITTFSRKFQRLKETIKWTNSFHK